MFGGEAVKVFVKPFGTTSFTSFGGINYEAEGSEVALSSDGLTLAVAKKWETKIYGWTKSSWVERATVIGSFNPPGAPALSADGTTVAVPVEKYGKRTIEVYASSPSIGSSLSMERLGNIIRDDDKYTDGKGTIGLGAIDLSADGRRLAVGSVASDSVNIYDFKNGQRLGNTKRSRRRL